MVHPAIRRFRVFFWPILCFGFTSLDITWFLAGGRLPRAIRFTVWFRGRQWRIKSDHFALLQPGLHDGMDIVLQPECDATFLPARRRLHEHVRLAFFARAL